MLPFGENAERVERDSHGYRGNRAILLMMTRTATHIPRKQRSVTLHQGAKNTERHEKLFCQNLKPPPFSCKTIAASAFTERDRCALREWLWQLSVKLAGLGLAACSASRGRCCYSPRARSQGRWRDWSNPRDTGRMQRMLSTKRKLAPAPADSATRRLRPLSPSHSVRPRSGCSVRRGRAHRARDATAGLRKRGRSCGRVPDLDEGSARGRHSAWGDR